MASQPQVQDPATQQQAQIRPQVGQQWGEMGQFGATSQAGHPTLEQTPGQDVPTRQTIERAETPVIAEVLATRLGMTSEQLAQSVPQLAPFVRGGQPFATGQQQPPVQAQQPYQGQQTSPLQSISYQ